MPLPNLPQTDFISMHSDILTPLTAMGVHFEIDDHKGPIIEQPISSMEQVLAFRAVGLGTAMAVWPEECGVCRSGNCTSST